MDLQPVERAQQRLRESAEHREREAAKWGRDSEVAKRKGKDRYAQDCWGVMARVHGQALVYGCAANLVRDALAEVRRREGGAR